MSPLGFVFGVDTIVNNYCETFQISGIETPVSLPTSLLWRKTSILVACFAMFSTIIQLTLQTLFFLSDFPFHGTLRNLPQPEISLFLMCPECTPSRPVPSWCGFNHSCCSSCMPSSNRGNYHRGKHECATVSPNSVNSYICLLIGFPKSARQAPLARVARTSASVKMVPLASMWVVLVLACQGGPGPTVKNVRK